MATDADSFLKLCEKLRAMGACQIEGHGFKAIWLTAPVSAPPARPAREPGKRELAKATAAKTLSDEELREASRQRELGNL